MPNESQEPIAQTYQQSRCELRSYLAFQSPARDRIDSAVAGEASERRAAALVSALLAGHRATELFVDE
jgi:hypothetical protein